MQYLKLADGTISMRKLGLIGDFSWASTTDYYRGIHQEVCRQTRGACCANLVMTSLPYRLMEDIGQRAAWGEFLEYNTERPHEALHQETPASQYRSSPRAYPSKLPVPEYPGHFLMKRVAMKIAEPYCQLVITRWPVLTRLAAVLLVVMISVTTRPEHAAAQGTSSAVADPIRDSLALELMKVRIPSMSGLASATMYISIRLRAMLPADPDQRYRIIKSTATAFTTKYPMDSAARGSVAHTLAVRFTERELRELIAYERMEPEIERAMSAVAESVLTSHRAQLNDMVRNEVGTVTGTVPPPVAPGPLVLVTARPPFLPASPAES